MNNSKTPKIVIGVGLAAVYAAGLTFFTVRGVHDNVITQSASTAPIAADSAQPSSSMPASAESSPSVVEQPAAMTAAVESASASTKAQASVTSVVSDVRSRSKEQALGSLTAALPAEHVGAEKALAPTESVSALSESADAGAVPSPSVGPASSGNDSQITADVKSQIAAVAPAEAIDVTTKDGVVELTGSVPSEEVADRARLAARNVAYVRDVDVSALTISN